MKKLTLAMVALFALSGSAAAQSLADYDYENLTFRGIGFDYGYIWPTRVEPTSSYTLRLDLGYLGPGVRIAPSISYWSSNFKKAEIARFADQLNALPALQDRGVVIQPEELGSIEWSDFSLALDAHFVWTTPLKIYTYLGAGAALHIMNGSGSAVTDTFIEDLLDTTTPGIALMAGAEVQPFTRFRFYGEGRLSLLNDLRYPGLRLGGALMLPSRTMNTRQGG